MVEREEVGIHAAVLAWLGLPLDVQCHRRYCVRGSYSCATVIMMNDHGGGSVCSIPPLNTRPPVHSVGLCVTSQRPFDRHVWSDKTPQSQKSEHLRVQAVLLAFTEQ